MRATSASRGPRPASVQSITDARSPSTMTLSGWKSPWHTTADPSSAARTELLRLLEGRREVGPVELRDDLPRQAQAVVDERRRVGREPVRRQRVQPEGQPGELVHQPARPPRLGAEGVEHRRAGRSLHHLRRKVEPVLEHRARRGRGVPCTRAPRTIPAPQPPGPPEAPARATAAAARPAVRATRAGSASPVRSTAWMNESNPPAMFFGSPATRDGTAEALARPRRQRAGDRRCVTRVDGLHPGRTVVPPPARAPTEGSIIGQSSTDMACSSSGAGAGQAAAVLDTGTSSQPVVDDPMQELSKRSVLVTVIRRGGPKILEASVAPSHVVLGLPGLRFARPGLRRRGRLAVRLLGAATGAPTARVPGPRAQRDRDHDPHHGRRGEREQLHVLRPTDPGHGRDGRRVLRVPHRRAAPDRSPGGRLLARHAGDAPEPPHRLAVPRPHDPVGRARTWRSRRSRSSCCCGSHCTPSSWPSSSPAGASRAPRSHSRSRGRTGPPAARALWRDLRDGVARRPVSAGLSRPSRSAASVRTSVRLQKAKRTRWRPVAGSS